MKFYVYVTKAGDHKDFEFVEEGHVDSFAESVFDASIMSFSGAAVEAATPEDAKAVYNNPACGFGEYISTDEPMATATKRALENAKGVIKKSFDDMTARLNHMRIILKMRLVATKLEEANELMNQVAKDIYENANCPPDLTVEEVFRRISKPSIDAKIKFNGESEEA